MQDGCHVARCSGFFWALTDCDLQKKKMVSRRLVECVPGLHGSAIAGSAGVGLGILLYS